MFSREETCPVMVVQAGDATPYLTFSYDSYKLVCNEGEFSVEADREIVNDVVQTMVDKKLCQMRVTGSDKVTYRFLFVLRKELTGGRNVFKDKDTMEPYDISDKLCYLNQCEKKEGKIADSGWTRLR